MVNLENHDTTISYQYQYRKCLRYSLKCWIKHWQSLTLMAPKQGNNVHIGIRSGPFELKIANVSVIVKSDGQISLNVTKPHKKNLFIVKAPLGFSILSLDLH